ncbi:MAG: hypothetical protein HY326_12530 [Chloroflexi bacterium]|nr:hypothetical protein [Chloroflexota bacterium]
MIKKLAMLSILIWALASLFLLHFDKSLGVQAASSDPAASVAGATVTSTPTSSRTTGPAPTASVTASPTPSATASQTATSGATQTPVPVGTWVVYPNSPTTNNLRGVSLVSTGEGWAVGDGGVVLHFLNGAWSDVTPSNVEDFQQLTWFSISMASSGVGWMVGEYYDSYFREIRGILAQYDGATWTIHPGEEVTLNQIPMKPLRSIYMASPTEGFTVGLDAEIVHYYDGAWHKEIRDGPNFYTVGGTDAQWVWIGGDNGRQLYRDESGDWQFAGIWTNATVNSTSFADRDYGWFTTDGPGVLLYDASVNACPLDCKTQNHVVNGLVGVSLRSVKLVNRTDGWMVGTDGVILHGPNDDPYDKWTVVRQPRQDAPDLNSVDMVSSREGWIAGDQGTLLHYSLPAEPTTTVTGTPTPTSTPSPTATATGTATPTATRTSTRTVTRTPMPNSTMTQTATSSVTPVLSPTQTATATQRATETVVAPTATATATPTASVTASVTVTPTMTPTVTLTPSVPPTASATPSETATPTAIVQPTARLFLPLLFREWRIIRQ